MCSACYSAKALCHNPNPIALGSRWLAYADKKVGFCQKYVFISFLNDYKISDAF